MLILTDCDGVLLNWEYAFDVWMDRKGYKKLEKYNHEYNIGKRYGIEYDHYKMLIREFNESAMIGFLPPLRDAVEYVQKLHRRHGCVFHVISSLSLDPSACQLRTQNLNKIFGENIFEGFTYLDTGADKDDALAKYEGKELYWIEDNIENAELGMKLGLKSILVEHGHNMNHEGIPKVRYWQELYNMIT